MPNTVIGPIIRRMRVLLEPDYLDDFDCLATQIEDLVVDLQDTVEALEVDLQNAEDEVASLQEQFDLWKSNKYDMD